MRTCLAVLTALTFLCLLNPPPANAQFDRCVKGLYDPRNGGECWSCPSGFGRTVFAVTAANACEKGGPFGQHVKAAYKGKPGCPAGAFRNGVLDQCYSCPEGFKRSARSGDDLTKVPDACVR